MSPALEVIEPGLMTTIQDLGRFGHQAQGVPSSGALDAGNLRLANALVHNSEGLGALEMRILGPTFKVTAGTVRVALTGTEGGIEISGGPVAFVPAYRSVVLKAGQSFRIGRMSDSAVCYLAVEGGFDLPMIYGSQSTYVSGRFGGFEGRTLQRGDLLPLCLEEASDKPVALCTEPLLYRQSGPIRVVPGPQDDYFDETALKAFQSQVYLISAESNRMGLRLLGEPIAHAKGADINSDGIVTGSIQVPGSGLPIILLADHQTTGGYPKIATVASVDLARLGRMVPGAPLQFRMVSVEEAETAAIALETHLRSLIETLIMPSDERELLDHLLMSKSLISGPVVD